MRAIRSVANLAALVIIGGLGVALIVTGATDISMVAAVSFFDTFPGTLVLILFGAALVLAAIRYLIGLMDDRLNAGLFSHEGDWGRIGVSPFAIKESISGILRNEIGIERFRIRLAHLGDGVGITVRTVLGADQIVPAVGERIQRELAREIAQRTGVVVKKVSVIVRSIQTGSPQATEEKVEDAIDTEQ